MLAFPVINLLIVITTAVNSYTVCAPPWLSTDTVALEYCRSPLSLNQHVGCGPDAHTIGKASE